MLHFSKITLLSALFLLLLSMAGCKETDSLDENNIRFETISKTAAYHLFNNPNNPRCDLSISLSYPNEFENEKILSELQNRFVVSAFGENYADFDPQQATEKYAESYIRMYREIEADFQKDKQIHNDPEDDFASWYTYYEKHSNEIVFNRANIISYTNKLETYTGGAHGAHHYSNQVIDLKTGDWIKECDIFIDDFKEPIAKLLIDKIVEINRVDDVSKLIEIGYFGIEEIRPNDNILIDEQGITYTFNEYEIAAYAIGATKVLLTFDEIGLYLKKVSPITHLLHN